MNWLDRAISLSLPLVPKPIVRRFSGRYIAGETIDEALAVVRALRAEGAMTTIDILGEFISSREEARANTEAYSELLGRIRSERIDQTNVSVKLTALGLLLDPELCLTHMRTLFDQVSGAGDFIRIDMEDSSCTNRTLDVYRALRGEYGERVGIVLQARLRRTLEDIDEIGRQPANVRLCKGIYLEPRDIAYTGAELIRRNFVRSLDRLFELGCYVGIATHDELLVWESERLIRERRLSADDYEFQMLLGVDEQLRRILIGSGHRLRVYVPYGPNWYAYSVRRLRENPQIAGYAFRSILRSG
ncbi:MAG TPA: proline dehydrogenase family protein [Candidatus Polarisedimenticolaceae bacterium]|nr:proline dehydrogenase family protein [Candidatus Polarisedimenticolaceae bacterium]